MWWRLWADVTDPTNVNPWTQLGIASIVCALLSTIAWILWRRLLAVQAEKDALYAARIEREQYLTDRLGPLLNDALSILGTAPAEFKTALTEARQSAGASELERVVRDLKDTVREIGH